jgi:hypothetical protein
MSELRTLAVAAVMASFAVVPATAQDATLNCKDFIESTPESQTTAIDAMVMEIMGASGTATTMEEITSLLLEGCDANPEASVINQLREIPLAVKN